jgi:conjugal transfer pilus assembly protein TraW
MRFSKASSRTLAALLITSTSVGLAGELGTIGPTYTIQEPDMLEWIEKRVQDKVNSGEALRYQKEQAEKIKKKLENPEPLKSVAKATKNRTFYFDPTFTVEESVLDDKGAILVPAGTTINPLDRVGLSRPLIFFDARDPVQVAFAKKYIDRHEGLAKPILVGGSYFELMKKWQTPVYFDQQSALIRKFSIRYVPAIVFQEGKRLRIDEIAL